MIKAKEAIRVARSLIGTPYSELDCINLIKKVIRSAPGGVSGYTTAGTNTLWDSYNASAKYRDLNWRKESIAGARAGMLAFKRDGGDVHHVGLVTGDGTVIHSSSAQGGRGVVETTLDGSWDLLAEHRYIEVEYETEEESEMQAYQAKVALKDGNKPGNYLAVRSAPDGDRIGRIEHGVVVTVQTNDGTWAFVTKESGVSGYVHAQYLQRVETDVEPEDETMDPGDGWPLEPDAADNPDETIGEGGRIAMVIIDEKGNEFFPVGRISVAARVVYD